MNKRAELTKGIDQFNRGDFFACHETLEELWMFEVGQDRRFYQGVLQLSVGCFHLLNGNYLGAESQWDKGCTKLYDFGDEHLGVNLRTLLEQMRHCRETLKQIQSGQVHAFDLSLIPQIRQSGTA
jgi:uncharacterized protein